MIRAYMKVWSLYCRKKIKTRVSGLICNFSVFGFQTLDVAVLNYLFILNWFYFFPKFFFHFFPIYERKSIGSRQGSSRSLIICLSVNFPWCILYFPFYNWTFIIVSYSVYGIHATSTNKRKISTNPVICDDVAQLEK